MNACTHNPPCPPAGAPDELAAHIVSDHMDDASEPYELLCNGLVVFSDHKPLVGAA